MVRSKTGRKESMTRNLRALGVAMFALLALGAVYASSASAAGEEFHCDEAPCILTGTTETPESVEEFKAMGVTVKCHGQFEATQATKTAKVLTVSPHYTECNNSTTVRTNHCDYTFAAETNAAGHGATNVKCSGGTKIEVDIKGVCILNFGEQTVEQGVHYTNVGTSSVTVEATAKGIVFTKTSDATHTLCGTITGTGSYGSKTLNKCFQDLGTPLTETAATTPTGTTKEGVTTECFWK
jgi:hypothetical protein